MHVLRIMGSNFVCDFKCVLSNFTHDFATHTLPNMKSRGITNFRHCDTLQLWHARVLVRRVPGLGVLEYLCAWTNHFTLQTGTSFGDFRQSADVTWSHDVFGSVRMSAAKLSLQILLSKTDFQPNLCKSRGASPIVWGKLG